MRLLCVAYTRKIGSHPQSSARPQTPEARRTRRDPIRWPTRHIDDTVPIPRLGPWPSPRNNPWVSGGRRTISADSQKDWWSDRVCIRPTQGWS